MCTSTRLQTNSLSTHYLYSIFCTLYKVLPVQILGTIQPKLGRGAPSLFGCHSPRFGQLLSLAWIEPWTSGKPPSNEKASTKVRSILVGSAMVRLRRFWHHSCWIFFSVVFGRQHLPPLSLRSRLLSLLHPYLNCCKVFEPPAAPSKLGPVYAGSFAVLLTD